MEFEQTECSETSAYKIHWPWNYQEESIQQKNKSNVSLYQWLLHFGNEVWRSRCSSLIHCCRPKCCHLFSLLCSLFSLHPRVVVRYHWLYRPSCLRTGWWKTSFSSLKIARVYNRNLITCVLNSYLYQTEFYMEQTTKCKDIYCDHTLYLQHMKLENICIKQIFWRIWSKYPNWPPKRSGNQRIENGIWWNFRGIYYAWNVVPFVIFVWKVLTSFSAIFLLVV